MKLKMTDDFKKGAKGILAYVITAILVYPILHLIKGDFNWADTLLNSGIQVAIAVVVGAFFFFGSQIPEKKED